MKPYKIDKVMLNNKLTELINSNTFYNLIGYSIDKEELKTNVEKILEIKEDRLIFEFSGKITIRFKNENGVTEIKNKLIYDTLDEYIKSLVVRFKIVDSTAFKRVFIQELQKKPIRCDINLVEFMCNCTWLEVQKGSGVRIRKGGRLITLRNTNLVNIVEKIQEMGGILEGVRI